MNFDVLDQKPVRIMWSKSSPGLRKGRTGSTIVNSQGNKYMHDFAPNFGGMFYGLSVLTFAIFVLNLSFVGAHERFIMKKASEFTDPNTLNLYNVKSYEVTNADYKSAIRVTRVKLNHTNPQQPVTKPETVQKLKFESSLVDFDLHCAPNYCYMVVITSQSKRNVELFAWKRTQFDYLWRRDSFARPNEVKLFKIADDFYVAVAQEQVQLSPHRTSRVSGESTRFYGNAILKFKKGSEQKARYHQFIRLPFSPKHVNYFTASNAQTLDDRRVQQADSYFLVFSNEANWHKTRSSQTHTFIWSSLDTYFWPYKLPSSISVENATKPVSSGYRVQFSSKPAPISSSSQIFDFTEATEACFHQLQRILSDRDLNSRHLADVSKSIWRHSAQQSSGRPLPGALTNISSQVIVHGNVTVQGSMIESPQVSLLGAHHLTPPTLSPTPVIDVKTISGLMKSLSPNSLDQKLKQSQAKLKYIKEKLASAVLSNLPNNTATGLSSQIRFSGILRAKEVILRGVANSDVHLNAIPFHQLEHELVSLSGSQVIMPQVKFRGRVLADFLEIHALINDKYLLRDAIDVKSGSPQIIEVPSLFSSASGIEFNTLIAPSVKMLHNATINGIQLDDFITRSNRTQVVLAHKVFKRLRMDRLDLAHHDVLLNHFHLGKISNEAVRLRELKNHPRVIHASHTTFGRQVYANRLLIRNAINSHINLSLIIQDSVKTEAVNVQRLFGSKNFLNGLRINRLSTQGLLNGIEVNDIFDLNSDQSHLPLGSDAGLVTGNFKVLGPVIIEGNLSAKAINGIDINRAAVRRAHPQSRDQPQIIRGRKTFLRPLRVVDNVTLLDAPLIAKLRASNTTASYPLINGIDLKNVSASLAQKLRPSMIYIDNLDINGNINLPTDLNTSRPIRATFGQYTGDCPLDVMSTRALLAGKEDQTINIPLRIETFRARSVRLGPESLNGMSFPQDFVLRNGVDLEEVHGAKTFERILVAPSITPANMRMERSNTKRIVLDAGTRINNLDFNVLRTFMRHEVKLNSTGEQYFDTIIVNGNINAKRVNGQSWPDDILLKSLGTVSGPPESPYVHNRIYSPLVFLNSSSLTVGGQLVLRGPVKLHGKMNGVNLTQFSHHSATYGDKDLFYSGRPLTNKLFIGGLGVRGELRSQGLIDDVNFDEMRGRVLVVSPKQVRQSVTGMKVFMSDTIIRGKMHLLYLNDLPISNYLSRISLQSDGIVHVLGKKTVTGALRINRNLFVDGLINGVDYAQLSSKAIPLSRPQDELRFNKTLYIEGDVYMDDIWVNEKNGTIDGVKLADMVPIERYNSRQPVSVNYELGKPITKHMPISRRTREAALLDPVSRVRDHFIPSNLITFSTYSDIIVGFIEASYQNLAGYQLPPGGALHSDHLTDDLRSFMVLDQVDFSYSPVTYHLSAVVSKGSPGENTTSVMSSIGGRPHEPLSMLPVKHPNSAIFINDEQHRSLLLMISQDYTIHQDLGFVCPVAEQIPRDTFPRSADWNKAEGNIHVYLFYALQNSSSLRSAYFDLYQTIDLPEIDSFASFDYHGSIYALAASRSSQRIYLLLLRGFSGFQVVSYIEAPMMERCEVVFAPDERPAIVIYQTNGAYKIFQSITI